MIFVSIFLFVIALIFFFNARRHLTLLIILVLSSNFFDLVEPSFILGPISLQYGDLALVLIFLMLPFRTKINSEDILAIKKALVIFSLFFFVSASYDYFSRGTSLMQIFRTSRKLGYLMFFPLLSTFSKKDYELLIKYLLYLTFFHSIFYISQYIFQFEMSGMSSANIDGTMRFRNAPYYLVPIFIFLVYNQDKFKLSKYYLGILILVFVLGQSRGAIISVLSILLIYFYLEKIIKFQTVISILLIVSVGYLTMILLLPDLSYRFEEGYYQILSLNDINYGYNLAGLRFKGTFIFRIGILYERFIYVIQHSSTILLGVGYLPDMDIIRPIFQLGTHSPTLPSGYEQFNSVDIFFPNIVTRYGIVGSIIYLYAILQIGKYAINHIKYLFGKILFTYLFALVSISFINESFYNAQIFMLIFILVGLIVCDKMEIENQ